MVALVFFYGTLLARLNPPVRRDIDRHLTLLGRGRISADLFDLGAYPAAVPVAGGRVWGELYTMSDPQAVLSVTDEFEGYDASDEHASLYVRRLMPVTLENREMHQAWVYVLERPPAHAARIATGDYLKYLASR